MFVVVVVVVVVVVLVICCFYLYGTTMRVALQLPVSAS